MPKFEVYCGETLIGHSELEMGDAPMGVAMGKFLPNDSYAAIQPAVLASQGRSQVHLELSVRLSGIGRLPAQGGIVLIDCSPGLGDDGLEVEVLGIGYPLYEELFPHHVAAYRRQFS